MRRTLFIIGFTLMISLHGLSQPDYPAPVKFIELNIESRMVKMAYMDILPADTVSRKTILLLHGKNFDGYYWKELIPYLTAAGYRVIIPDQVGWGKSDRANLHYSFHMLANNVRLLLKQLRIDKTVVLAHSMGGMLATRFALLYPEMVEKLILENPIGLEDYKTFVPYQPVDSLYKKEKAASKESYKNYQQSYYPLWLAQCQQYIDEQAKDLNRSDFDSVAFINAITYQMIYEQPVCYEFSQLHVPVLLVIGQADRTVVGKEKLTDSEKLRYGNYPLLGKITKDKISGALLQEMPGVGHIPHIQDTKGFWKIVGNWLQ